MSRKKRKHTKKEQASAKKTLNRELAALFDVELPREDDAGGGADEEQEEDESTLLTVEEFRTRLTEAEASLNSLPLANVDDLKAALELESIQTDKQIHVVIDSLFQQADTFSDAQRAAILQKLTAYIARLKADQEVDEDKPTDRPEAQPDSVPTVTPAAAETGTQEEQISKLRQGSELARLNALLVAQAEGQLFVRLKELGYSEEKAEELIAAYHGDLTNLIWAELLGAGGYAMLKGQQTQSLGAVELTQIWPTPPKLLVMKFWLPMAERYPPIMVAIMPRQNK